MDKAIFLISILIVFPIVSFLFLRFVYIIWTQISNFEIYRSDVFGLAGRESILFVTNLNAFIYANTVGPLLFFILFYGTSSYILTNKLKILIISYLLIAMDTTMMMGRFGFYYILFSILFILIIKLQRGRQRAKKIIKDSLYASVIFGTLIVSLVMLSIYRSGGVNDFKKKVLSGDLINYHIASFGIVNLELNNPNSIIHSPSYGRSTLGSIERWTLLGLKNFGISGTPQGDLNGEYLHENRLIGYTRDGRPMLYNAFGSIFFSMYRDGGNIFISLCGVICGVMIFIFSSRFRMGELFSGVLLAHIFFVLIFGIFQPITSGPISLSFLLSIGVFSLSRRRF